MAVLNAIVALCLCGCSVSMPLGSFLPSDHSDDTAATISNDRISGFLEGEDWRRAKAALIAALDPQGNGEAVQWTNPNSGAKGSFAADGKPYPSDTGICRGFVADVDRKNGDNSLHGTACAAKAGEWTVTEIKQGRKG